LAHPELLNLPEELYENIFCYSLCPAPLFREIAAINYLRAQIALESKPFVESRIESLRLLMRIDAWSPEQWAIDRDATTHTREFSTVGIIYQAAVIMYCILSLQSLGMLDPSPEVSQMQEMYSDVLLTEVKRALSNATLRFFMTFPTTVAGVVAVKSSAATQDWIAKGLDGLIREHGQAIPVKAGLARFWASGKTAWEDCFDVSYALSC
jgi:hypothetical protein